ncbi:MAG: sugar phosphate nucleotidyltransferase, partial [Gammaproteobacteria bacterium]
VLVLGGDHVYKMDYGPLLAAHVEHAADVTVACMEVPLAEASDFGVMKVDREKRVTDFLEKPPSPPSIPGSPDRALVSMGIYVFDTAFLDAVLSADEHDPASSHDFGKDIIPAAVKDAKVFAYPFRDKETGAHAYWRDVGSLDSYWAANLELIGLDSEIDLYDRGWPIWTYHPPVPPAKFAGSDPASLGVAIESLVGGGCIVASAEVRRSILSANVRVEQGSRLEECVVLHDVTIAPRCRLRRVVIDSRCRLPAGTTIGYDAQEDARRFELSPGGIAVVTPEMLGQDTWRVG